MQGELEGILSEAGVDPSISVHILGAGWTKQSFAVCALSLSGLDNHWDDLLGDASGLSLQQRACVRVAWQMCQQSTQPSQPVAHLRHPLRFQVAGRKLLHQRFHRRQSHRSKLSF